MLDIILAGALAAIGMDATKTVLENILTSAGGVGMNWVSNLTERSYQEWRDGWFSERGALNHDIAKLLTRSFHEATQQIERDWTGVFQHATTPEAIATALHITGDATHPRWLNHLGQTTQRHRLLNQLRRLREESHTTAEELIAADNLDDHIRQYTHLIAQIIQPTTPNDATIASQTLFTEKLHADFLTKQPPELVVFIRQQITYEWLLRFREGLKKTDEQSTRAWRAYQLLWHHSLQTTVETTRQTTDDIREVVLWLHEWAERLDRLPVTQRDPTGDDALDRALQPLRESMQQMRDTLDAMHQTVSFIEMTTTRTDNTVTRTETGVQRLEQTMQSLRTDLGRLTRSLTMPEYTIYANVLQAHRRTTLAALNEAQTYYFERHRLFAGRDRELARIHDFLDTQPRGYIYITAPSGYGKTALLANLIDPERERYCWYFLNRLDNTHRRASLLRQMCEQMLSYYQIEATLPPDYEPGQLDALYAKLLRMPLVQAGKPLVLVIDGLDEAETELNELHIPRELPDGKYIIFSAREQAGRDDVQRLGLPRSEVLIIQLQTLDRDGIQQLLRKAGGHATTWADTPLLLNEVLRVSQGDPFYVRYLVEDIANGRVNAEQIGHQPAGLEAYLNGWWQQVEEETERQTVADLLGYLAVALGAMTRDELIRIRADDALKGRTFDGTLRAIRRFVVGNDTHGYTLCHPRFQAYVRNRMADEIADYINAVCAYCAEWQTHQSRYALRYYAHHLHQTQQWQPLTDLAHNETFWQAQVAAFSAEPDLPLSTIQLALMGAATCDDAGMMAHLLLHHAYKVHEITQENPFDALRAGNLERAWRLADLADAERRALWYLLFAWELHDRGCDDDARKTLERLLTQRLPRLLSWQADCAVMLLLPMLDIDEQLFSKTQQQLLDDEERVTLCEELAKRQAFAVALAIAHTIDDKKAQANALVAIAETQIQAYLQDDAKQTLIVVTQVAQAIANEWERTRTLETISDLNISNDVIQRFAVYQRESELHIIQAQMGQYAEALQTIQLIDNFLIRAQAQASVAIAQAQAGNITDAIQTSYTIDYTEEQARALIAISAAQAQAGDFAAAFDTVGTIGDDGWGKRWQALVAIATAQAQAGLHDDAKHTFIAATQNTEIISWDKNRVDALVAIAIAQAQAGLLDDAYYTLIDATHIAQTIKITERRAEILTTIAKAQIQIGDLTASFHTAQTIDNEWQYAEVLVDITKHQAQRGDFTAALQTIQNIDSNTYRSEALTIVGNMQMQAGLYDEANEIFAIAIHAALAIGDTNDTFSCEKALVAIAKTRIQAGDPNAVIHTAQTIHNDYWRAVALVALATAQVQACLYDDAKKTIAMTLHDTQTIDDQREPFYVYVLVTVAVIQASTDNLNDALATAQLIDNTEIGAIALTIIQANIGNFSAALQTVYSINNTKERVETLITIATLQMQTGLYEDSRHTFTDALATAHTIDDERERAIALAAIATAQAQAGLHDDVHHTITDALVTAHTIDDERERAETLAFIAKAQAQAGNFTDALAIVHTIERENKRAETLATIATAQAEAGLQDDALYTLTIARTFAQSSEWDKENALITIAIAYAQINDLSTALEIACTLNNNNEVLVAIASTQALASNFSAALQTVEAINWYTKRAQALTIIAAAQAQAGKFADALATAQNIDNEWQRVDALTDIAKAQAQAGLHDDAKHTFTDALTTAHTIIDEDERAYVLADIAKAQAQAGLHHDAKHTFIDALATAQTIDREWLRTEALIVIAEAQVTTGYGQDAIKTAALVQTEREKHLPTIAEALLTAHDLDNFKQMLIPCGFLLESAYKMCGLLAQAYPQQAAAVAEAVISHSKQPSAQR